MTSTSTDLLRVRSSESLAMLQQDPAYDSQITNQPWCSTRIVHTIIVNQFFNAFHKGYHPTKPGDTAEIHISHQVHKAILLRK